MYLPIMVAKSKFLNSNPVDIHVSRAFWWLNLVRSYSLYKIPYPKRRIESYSRLGTIVSPNKRLLLSASGPGNGPAISDVAEALNPKP